MIERHTSPSGALLVVVSDETSRTGKLLQVVLSAQTIPPKGRQRARLDWAVNPLITSISDPILGQVLEALSDLRENMWALDRLHFGEL